MITIKIPGYKELKLKYLTLDYNGTLAFNGMIIDGVKEKLKKISNNLEIHIISAGTFGSINEHLSDIDCVLSVISADNQIREKQKYIQQLGVKDTVAIGNGRNDRLMLKEAELGIAVIQKEGASIESVMAADLVTPDIISALELLENPLRLIATLRS
ncbi:MAG: ATPase P [Calditrichaceae bacterium]|nr:ATPase P [Calditrichaceae bacterium]MBN2709576.1 ATPase P [Calditrichaceae bacterium]